MIETERLILREIVLEDLDGLFELDSNPEVHRFLGNKPVKNKEELVDVIHFIRNQYKENGTGRLAIVDKFSNEFIGWAGLKLVKETINNHSNHYDLGYRLIEKYWGKGIATESAIASLEYGFEILALNEIYAAAHVENKASNKILIKIGFKWIETFEYDGSIHNWYKIEKR